jgi:hypothetical protein
MEQTLEQRIRQRAYEIWHAHGCTEGKADEHWLAAEHEVLSSANVLAVAAQASTLFAATDSVAPRKEKKRGGRVPRAAKASVMQASLS